MGDAQMGLQARLMSKALENGMGQNKAGCRVFYHQLRDKIGVMFGTRNYNRGNALKFYSSVRVDIRRSS